MRNKIIGFVVFLFWQMGASAQDTLKNTSILLVPFPPEYYLSDAERDIMAQTKRSPEEFRNYFRKTLDLKIQGELEVHGPCISLLQDTTSRGRKLLEMFYGKAGYSYAYPVGGRNTSKSSNIYYIFKWNF